MPPSTALKRRIAPSVPLKLELMDDGGATFVREFKLSFDFNAAAIVEEKTGLNLLTGAVWTSLSSRTLSWMLYAAILANHREYGRVDEEGTIQPTSEGIDTIRSYMDIGNTDVIGDAVWDAYFISLPKDKRESLEKARAALMTKVGKDSSPLAVAPTTALATPSDGSTSGQSPDTTSDSASASSAP